MSFASIFPNLQGAQQQPQPIEAAASQAPQQLGQALQNQQQQPQQDQDPVRQALLDKVNQASSAKFGVKQILQNFFAGVAHGMLPPAQTPEFQQQRALTNLATYDTTQANASLHRMEAERQQMLAQNMMRQPVPPELAKYMPGVQFATPAEMVGAAVKGNQIQMSTQGQEDLQDLKNTGAQTVQGMKNAEADKQLGSKLDMFHQTNEYNIWKTKFEAGNKLAIAQLNAGKAPATMLQTASFAQSGLNRLDDAQAAMQRLEARGVLGNVASNKIEDWIFGKGLIDPTLPAQDKEDIGRLRAAASYTSSAAMRAHTGRTSREIYDDFKNTMGINQGPDAWKGAMQETRSMLNDYAGGATNAAIQRLRTGSTPPAAGRPTHIFVPGQGLKAVTGQ